MSLRPVLAVFSAALLWSACAPPSLTEGADAGSVDGPVPREDANPPGPDPDADTAVPGDGATPPPFSEVASILVDNCAKANCHGDPSAEGQEFLLGSNDPSESDIRDELRQKTIDMPTAPLVQPGKPELSGLYQALIPLEGRRKMPLGGELEEEQIETIRAWIASGARYE